jgi:guanine deaminase
MDVCLLRLISRNSLVLADAFQSAGLRGFIGKLSMDKSTRPSYVETSTESSLASAASFIQRCEELTAHLPKHRQLVEPAITPRFVPTCTDELLSGLGQLSADLNVKVQSHLAEARDQVNWVKSERGVDDIEVFDRVSLCLLK